MGQKDEAATGSMTRLNLSLPEDTVDYFRRQAQRQGVPMQALIAPVLNAVARGEIKGGFEVVPQAHGNAKAGRERRQAA